MEAQPEDARAADAANRQSDAHTPYPARKHRRQTERAGARESSSRFLHV